MWAWNGRLLAQALPFCRRAGRAGRTRNRDATSISPATNSPWKSELMGEAAWSLGGVSSRAPCYASPGAFSSDEKGIAGETLAAAVLEHRLARRRRCGRGRKNALNLNRLYGNGDRARLAGVLSRCGEAFWTGNSCRGVPAGRERLRTDAAGRIPAVFYLCFFLRAATQKDGLAARRFRGGQATPFATAAASLRCRCAPLHPPAVLWRALYATCWWRGKTGVRVGVRRNVQLYVA